MGFFLKFPLLFFSLFWFQYPFPMRIIKWSTSVKSVLELMMIMILKKNFLIIPNQQNGVCSPQMTSFYSFSLFFFLCSVLILTYQVALLKALVSVSISKEPNLCDVYLDLAFLLKYFYLFSDSCSTHYHNIQFNGEKRKAK